MPELTRAEWEQLVERIDKQTLSPHERAQKVWILLEKEIGDKVDNWDVMCFCSWFLANMFPFLPDLERYSKMLDVKIHHVHYQGDLWKDTNVIRKLDSDSKKSERVSRDYSAE